MQNQNDYKIIVSVATDLGAQYLKDYKAIILHVGKMGQYEMEQFFLQEKFDVVVDASHPYADCVSEIAMKNCEKLNIEYIRFERKKSKFFHNAIYVKDFKQATEKLNQIKGNILFTTGTNHLEQYKMISNWEGRVFIRVLNEKSSIEKCLSAGFSIENIISQNAPFTKEQNLNHLIQYHIQAMITKDSGKIGGVMEKSEAAQEQNIPFIVIQRPQINYKNQFDTFKEIFSYLKDIRKKEKI